MHWWNLGHDAPAAAQCDQRLSILMQVEIKLRLKDEEAHARLAAALKASYRTTHEQENYFFDGSSAELSSARVILRLRFYNFDKKALLTVKVGREEGGGEGMS